MNGTDTPIAVHPLAHEDGRLEGEKLVRAKPLISGKVSLAYSTKVAQT